jgi:hypothetical protein
MHNFLSFLGEIGGEKLQKTIFFFFFFFFNMFTQEGRKMNDTSNHLHY